jgi:integrase
MYRRALETNSWTRAEALARDKEARGSWHDPDAIQSVTVEKAVNTFLASVTGTSHGHAKSTQAGIRTALQGVDAEWAIKVAAPHNRAYNDGLLDWCQDRSIVTLRELSLPVLSEYIGGMICGPVHLSKRIRILRRFFRFCVDSDWLQKNPAAGLVDPNGRELTIKQKEPFDRQTLPQPGPQWKAIVAHVKAHPSGPGFLALTLLMRHCGLRISDAVMFSKDKIMTDGSIFLHMKKTNEPVTIPMHPELRAALDAIPPNSSGYYFTTGQCALATATDNWRRRFEKVFKAAGIEGGHPHRFRHTFAVDLLLRGVPIDQVSVLLGHSSVRITERHYLSYVAGRRKQITDSVMQAWAATP